MVVRHAFVLAVRMPDPQEPIRLPLDRPVTLIDVLRRHPEWRRRLELTLRAKQAGVEQPDFPLLWYCVRCDREFFPRTKPPYYKLCPSCRPLMR